MLSAMDTLDLSSVLTPDFWFQQFGNLDGVHTGVPTLTTPTLTLTPSTFRNIEESIIQITRESQSHHNGAGFVPPAIEPVSQGKNTYLNLVDRQALLGGSTTITPTPAATTSRPVMLGQMSYNCTSPIPQTTRRNVGGRRPNKSSGISPEEEERRRVRRERNKLAAARCRKRRMDHTNELLLETEELERKKLGLQNDIKRLQDEKGQLEFLLEAHQANCRQNSIEQPSSPPEVKPLIAVSYHEPRVVVQSQPRCDATAFAPSSLASVPRRPQFGATAGAKPSRPSSLPVGTKPFEVDGVPITTPSTVIPFNFESLMDGGTGLTPVSSTGLSPLIPSCSSQQRNQCVDLSSPDNSYPPKLVSL